MSLFDAAARRWRSVDYPARPSPLPALRRAERVTGCPHLHYALLYALTLLLDLVGCLCSAPSLSRRFLTVATVVLDLIHAARPDVSWVTGWALLGQGIALTGLLLRDWDERAKAQRALQLQQPEEFAQPPSPLAAAAARDQVAVHLHPLAEAFDTQPSPAISVEQQPPPHASAHAPLEAKGEDGGVRRRASYGDAHPSQTDPIATPTQGQLVLTSVVRRQWSEIVKARAQLHSRIQKVVKERRLPLGFGGAAFDAGW